MEWNTIDEVIDGWSVDPSLRGGRSRLRQISDDIEDRTGNRCVEVTRHGESLHFNDLRGGDTRVLTAPTNEDELDEIVESFEED